MPGPMMFFPAGSYRYGGELIAGKKISPIEMGEILHEKIQLYIYKPSINKVTNQFIFARIGFV